MNPLQVLAFPGSTYRPSTAHQLIDFLATSQPNLTVACYEGLPEIPPFNPRLTSVDTPEIVKELRERIAAADGILFISPEYVFSLPGSLKNLLEWLVGTIILAGKPAAFIIAAASGQAAFDSLKKILLTLECAISDDSMGLIAGAKGKINPDGTITDPNTLQILRRVLDAFTKTMTENDALK